MNDVEIKDKLAEAERHFTYYRWDEAIACFETVLAAAPHHQGARDGIRQAKAKKAVEEKMVEGIAEAQAALDTGHYDQAMTALSRAQTLGADASILNHHAVIQGLREAVQERIHWNKQVARALERAKALESDKAEEQALETLDGLLRELTASGQDALGEQARRERDRLQGAMELDDRREAAQKAYEAEDYRRACALSEALHRDYPDDKPIAREYEFRKTVWLSFESRLQEAKETVDAEQLDEAVAMLARLRDDSPKNPDWQALWLRAFAERGRREFEAGRQAVQHHDFQPAQRAFAKAGDAFQQVLNVFPDHPSAGHGRAEVEALDEAMLHVLEAQQQEKELRWDAARSALRTARQKRMEASQVRNEGFGEVEAVLQALSGEVDERGKRWEDARAALQEGQSSLQSKDLPRAIKRFRQGVQSLGDLSDEQLRADLLQGLAQAEKRQQDVQLLLEQARSADDGQAALHLLRQVYERWPGAPGMPDTLAGQLVEVARQAMDAGQETLAAECCAEVDSLEGVSADLAERAQAVADAIGCREAVTGAVAEADRLADAERRKPRATAAGQQQVVDMLLRARSTTKDCPDLTAGIDERLKPAQERLKRLNKAEPLLDKAETQRQAGEWTQAARLQEQAVKALGDLATAGDAERLEAWQGAAVAVGQVLEQADKRLKQVTEQFRAVRDGDMAAVDWTELQSSLAEVQRILAEPPTGVDPLPVKWQELEERAQGLSQRSDVVLRAYESVLAGDPDLAELRALAAQSAGDVALAGVLRSLRAQSKGVLEEQANRSLEAARDHAERGEWSDATARLAEARAAGADLPEVATELTQLDRRIRLWQEIERLNLDGITKSNSNSQREALDAFREVLRRALDPDSGLPASVRDQVAELLTLENRLDIEDSLQRAQALQVSLVTVEAGQNRLVQTYLAGPVTQWFQLASRGALVRAIDSAMKLKEYEDAYASAKRAVNKDPDNQFAVDQATLAREEIMQRLLDSVRKRIERAQTLQDKGAFAEALADLDRINSEFIEPIETNFPEITGGDPDLLILRDEAADLRLEIEERAERAGVLAELTRTIRESFTNGQLDAAELAIEDAGRRDPSKSARQAWDEIDSLSRAVERERNEVARQAVRGVLSGARGALAGSPKEATVRQTLTNLENIRDQVEQLGDTKVSGEYRALLADVGTWLEGHEALAQELETAREKEQADALEEQFAALERAETLARGKELAAIHAKLTELRPRIDKQRQVQEAWDMAMDTFTAREFAQAQSNLAAARRLGMPEADVRPYQQATRAAILLAEARGLLRSEPEEALVRLQQAQRMIQDSAPAADIGLPDEIQIYLEAIERHERQQKAATESQQQEDRAIETLLRDAQAALRRGELVLARQKLDAIFDLQPKQPEATQLASVLQAEELRSRGDYRAALAQVTTILELHPTLVEARILEAQLKVETEAGEALAKARSLAEAKSFAEAQQELAKARDLNANHPRLAEVQGYVQEQEDRFRDRALGPAMVALRAKNFSGALSEYQILLTQAGAPDFKAEIEQYRQSALDQWADYEGQSAADELDKSQISLDELQRRRNRLQDVLKTAPGPSERRASTLQALVRRIEVRRLEQRLGEGRESMDRGDLNAAKVIADELAKEAQTLGEFALIRAVGEFGLEVERRQGAEIKQQRDQAVSQAKELFAQATTPEDLDAAVALAVEVLKLPGFTQDSDVLRLQREVKEEIERYDLTNKELATALNRLRTHWYRGAKQTLDEMKDPSRLLSEQLADVRMLQKQLQTAEDLEATNPEKALAIYLTVQPLAVKTEYRLDDNVQTAIERCKEQLGQQALHRAEIQLSKTIPDHERALAELDQAVQHGWIVTADQEVQASNLRVRIQGLALTALAIQAVVEREAMTEALAMFQQARDQMPTGELDSVSAGWQAVAEATIALDAEQLDVARMALHQVPEVLIGEPVLLKTRARLEALESTAQTVDSATAAVDAALLKTPPDYEGAVSAARVALSAAVPPTGRAEAVAARVADRMLEEVETLRKQGRYEDALATLNRLSVLAPDVTSTLHDELTQEQTQRLDESIAQAQWNLNEDDLELAAHQVARARRLAGTTPDRRVSALDARLEQRRSDLKQADGYVQAARAAMQPPKLDLTTAVQNAAAAQSLARRYGPVHQVVADLRTRLFEEIELARATASYDMALGLCVLALELGSEDTLVQKRQQVLLEQTKAADATYDQAQAALTIFDLERAESSLAIGRQANASDGRFERLDKRLHQARQVAPTLKQALETCWAHLQQRDFARASAALMTGMREADDFQELRAWKRHISSLVDGIELSRLEKRSTAAHYFAEAEKSLRWGAKESLSPLWGTRLRDERCQAVYYAHRLRREVSEMESESQRGYQLWNQGNKLEASPVLSALLNRQKLFSDFVAGHYVAPARFDASEAGFVDAIAGVAVSTAQPPVVTSTPEVAESTKTQARPPAADTTSPFPAPASETTPVVSATASETASDALQTMAAAPEEAAQPEVEEATQPETEEVTQPETEVAAFVFDWPLPDEAVVAPSPPLPDDSQPTETQPAGQNESAVESDPVSVDDWDSWWLDGDTSSTEEQ